MAPPLVAELLRVPDHAAGDTATIFCLSARFPWRQSRSHLPMWHDLNWFSPNGNTSVFCVSVLCPPQVITGVSTLTPCCPESVMLIMLTLLFAFR
jgi:hypothetical protein